MYKEKGKRVNSNYYSDYFRPFLFYFTESQNFYDQNRIKNECLECLAEEFKKLFLHCRREESKYYKIFYFLKISKCVFLCTIEWNTLNNLDYKI